MYMHMYNGHLRTWFYGPQICVGLCTYCCKPNIYKNREFYYKTNEKVNSRVILWDAKLKVSNRVVTLHTSQGIRT